MGKKSPAIEFRRVLDVLRELSNDELDKGKRFERLTAAVLRTAPQWATKFSNVWLWEDWPGNEGKPDTGIDLVAEDRQTGDLTGVLHAPDYRYAFAADLKKELPRIPRPSNAEQFWAFSAAGRKLSELHLDYEDVEPWTGLDVAFADGFDPEVEASWRVEKMRYPKVIDPDSKKKVDDKTTIVYNSSVTIFGIPERAHEYVIGSRSAIDWILDRYQVKTHKASGIVNDPNDWGLEHDNPAHIFDLLRSIVTVSMRTLDIIDELPALDL